MWCEALDARGARAWMRGGIVPDEEGRLTVNVSVPPGVYRLVGETNNGLRVAETIEVRGYEGADAPLSVRLFRPE